MRGDESPEVRPWLLVVFAVVLLGGAGLTAFSFAQRWWLERKAHTASVAAKREEREQITVHVSPSPLPLTIPLAGAAGTDVDGYPLQYVDRGGLRALLAAGHFKELTRYFEQFQAAFEADPRKEYWPADAGSAFASSEPQAVASLDAWVAETPDSFAPYLARGSHYLGAMWAKRGGNFVADTPVEDLRAMSDPAARAVEDLEHAIKLRPKLVAAMTDEMDVTMTTSDSKRFSKMQALAFHACAGCLEVRVEYMLSLTPRWGGSPDEMRSFADSLNARDNPRFRALGGYVDFDRAETVMGSDDKNRFARALEAVDLALRHGQYWEYLLLRAKALRGLARFDEALDVLNQAGELRPMGPSMLAERAALHCNREEYLAAGRDLLAALRDDPTHWTAKRYATDVVHGLLGDARRLDAEGKRQEALESIGVLLDLCPTDGPALALHDKIVGEGGARAPDGAPR
jgi:tetratricopeptide (TPR) repeat protein